MNEKELKKLSEQMTKFDKANLKEFRKLWKEIKDEPERKTIDISGMGRSYEYTCQKMLFAGLDFLKNRPDFDWGYTESKDIVGICLSETNDAKELDRALLHSANDDCTGAMHQAVIHHLFYIHKNGIEKWLKENEERIYVYPKELPSPIRLGDKKR